ncbi:MAG: helix-turn-helix domain-containing protein [Aquabacterium sp.]
MNQVTQVDLVRKHLKDGKTITPVIANAVYGISRLSSVIEDLRAEGMQIDTLIKFDEMGKQYGEYRQRRPITKGCKVQIKRGSAADLPNWVRRQKASPVVEKQADASRVMFIRGRNIKSVWLNDKELINVD